MFNPARTHFFEGDSPYEGTKHVSSVRTKFESGRVKIQRPLNFVGRANPDVAGTVTCLAQPKVFDLDARYRYGEAAQVTERPRTDNVSVSFPLTRSCKRAVYYPETGGGMHYVSDPSQLYDLARMLCPEKELRRTSKVRRQSEAWAATGSADIVSREVAVTHATWPWRFQDNPVTR